MCEIAPTTAFMPFFHLHTCRNIHTRNRDFTTTRRTINTFCTLMCGTELSCVWHRALACVAQSTRERSQGYSLVSESRSLSFVKLRLVGTVHVPLSCRNKRAKSLHAYTLLFPSVFLWSHLHVQGTGLGWARFKLITPVLRPHDDDMV